MTSRLNPYLGFRDNARQAMEFYRSALGGELTISTFGEFGQTGSPTENLVMHSLLETPDGFTLMAADTPHDLDYNPGTNISISLSGDDADSLRSQFANLSDGGAVLVPLAVQMWGDEFGMLQDRFGIRWMVNIAATRS